MTPIKRIKGKAKLSQYSYKIYRNGMYTYGHEFYYVYLKTRSSPVKYYLLGHALELFLKSFLINKGYRIKRLKSKPFSHNIEKLLEESIQNGLEDCFRISTQLKSDITSFSSVYADKSYEYFPILAWLFGQKQPRLDRISRFVKQNKTLIL